MGVRAALDGGRIHQHLQAAEIGHRGIDRGRDGTLRRNVKDRSIQSLARTDVVGGFGGARQTVRRDVIADDSGALLK